jgi:hypothetical protein
MSEEVDEYRMAVTLALQPEFQPFGKIARLSRECVITEKIDGTNGLVYVNLDTGSVLAGSRNRWLVPGKTDNFGFASWVMAHAADLARLGHGYHYGEWWGVGIGRGYGLFERRFSLFHVAKDGVKPACCAVVPQLYVGLFETDAVGLVIDMLRASGSRAAPGFMAPEGVVVYHKAAGTAFKVTLEHDDEAKGRQEVA